MPQIPSPPGILLAGEFTPGAPGHQAELAAFVAAGQAAQAQHGIPCLLLVRQQVGAQERLYLIPAGAAPAGAATLETLAGELQLASQGQATALDAEPDVDWAAAIAAAQGK